MTRLLLAALLLTHYLASCASPPAPIPEPVVVDSACIKFDPSALRPEVQIVKVEDVRGFLERASAMSDKPISADTIYILRKPKFPMAYVVFVRRGCIVAKGAVELDMLDELMGTAS